MNTSTSNTAFDNKRSKIMKTLFEMQYQIKLLTAERKKLAFQVDETSSEEDFQKMVQACNEIDEEVDTLMSEIKAVDPLVEMQHQIKLLTAERNKLAFQINETSNDEEFRKMCKASNKIDYKIDMLMLEIKALKK